jgi:DNA mismatch repair protein MutL
MKADTASIDINIHPTKTEVKFEDERAIWQILMASVREALGRFNIVPSLDFENEAFIEIPVRSSSGNIPEPPVIEINTQYNPFADEEKGLRSGVIDRFERENRSNWERLYWGKENEEKTVEHTDNYNGTQRRFFQIKSKYILCPVKSGLMMIDQKRAHERILFERFMDSLSSKMSVGQASMFPVTVEMSPADYILLKEIEEDISLLGFDFRHLGNNIISINSQPAENSSSNPGELLKTALEVYKNTESDPATGIKEKVAAAMARASAIPYGKILSQSEMSDLFDSLFGCSAPNYSPGGKPVINIITLEELDKRFK